ncbi:opioid growth factor receptor-like [Esox lucius]|uniref:Opioid growth factor receptor (OGFr) conserved domain-containing protein n=1 Tax=Esox lucius TaxID=8010 RepID=A0AAY5K6E7_ESOLU|nr:opioid growth factor receptor-like [Esox lucius]
MKVSWNAFLSIWRSLFTRFWRAIMPPSSQNEETNHRSSTQNKSGWNTLLSIWGSIFTLVRRAFMPNNTRNSLQSPQYEMDNSTVLMSFWPVEKKDKYCEYDCDYDSEYDCEYDCEYDSTWEDQTGETVRRRSAQRSYRFNIFRNAARDMQKYRHDYPERTMNNYSSVQDMPNLKFYLGQRTSSPDGVSIDDFHNKWKGDYSKLERVHSYIQWLFPLQEPGMNYQAKELTKKEIKAFLQNDTAKQRLLKSYKLMLDFYGIKLSNETTGDVETAENWRKRFENLDRNSHNNLRITRILKCLGTLGFPHYQAPLVKFFLEQTLVKGRLDSVKESALNYFIFAVLDKQERRELVKYAYQHYEPKHEFVWCPKTIQSMFEEEPFSGDDTTAIKQGNMYIAHGNIPMNKIRMAGEASDFMQLDQQSYSGGMTEVSIPQNNMPSQWGHDTGSRQGSKTKNGGDQNTRNDSATEHLLISQNSTSHSSYGALAISNSIATTDPTTKAPSSDQRKRTAVKREEGPPIKYRRGSEEDTHSDNLNN